MKFLFELHPWEWLLVGFFASALVGGVAVLAVLLLAARALSAVLALFSR